MNNRRSFFKKALGTLVAPFLPNLPVSKPVEFVPAKATLGYKGREFYDTGIIYCPYIPLIRTPELTMSLEMQKEIDQEMINRMQQIIREDFYTKQTIATHGELV
jgi:hypothetical protein